MLYFLGLAMVAVGCWFGGAMVVARDHPNQRKIAAGYMIAFAFIGIGLLIIFEI